MTAPRIHTGHIERMVSELTIGTIQAMKRREQQSKLEGLAEREEQFQIDVSGRSEEFPSWTEVTLAFETVFIDGRGQRDSDLYRPQFYSGAECLVGGPVGLFACVTEWKTTDKNETDGCVLAIGAAANDFARTFSGRVHATFQGFGCPSNCYGDPAQLDNG